jgi:HK97 family phage portal protein
MSRAEKFISSALQMLRGRGSSAKGSGAASTPAPIGGYAPWSFYATDERIDLLQALTLSVVWGCVMAIAEGIAGSDWIVFEEDQSGRRENRRGPVHELLNNRSNPEQGAFDFVLTVVVNALLDKAGYAEIVRDRRGFVHALWPLRADRVTRERINGELHFRVANFSVADALIHHEDMISIRALSLDGENSAPLIDFARSVLSRAKATRDFGSAFYRNGTTFGGMFIPKGPAPSPETRKTFINAMREQFAQARNAHGNIMLPADMDYKSFGIDPDKAQFIQTEQHLVEEVCRYFRVPPHKVQHLLRATNNNIEHQGIEFVRDAVMPWSTRLRDEFDWKVCAYEGLRCRPDLDWLREGDAKSVAEAESLRIHSAQVSPDESRRRRGYNPIPGGAGERFFLQGAMNRIERIGEAAADIAARRTERADSSEVLPFTRAPGA